MSGKKSLNYPSPTLLSALVKPLWRGNEAKRRIPAVHACLCFALSRNSLITSPPQCISIYPIRDALINTSENLLPLALFVSGICVLCDLEAVNLSSSTILSFHPPMAFLCLISPAYDLNTIKREVLKHLSLHATFILLRLLSKHYLKLLNHKNIQMT